MICKSVMIITDLNQAMKVWKYSAKCAKGYLSVFFKKFYLVKYYKKFYLLFYPATAGVLKEILAWIRS